MPSIRISELPVATTLALSGDYFPIVQGGITKKGERCSKKVNSGESKCYNHK
jgi:hypothetical protein